MIIHSFDDKSEPLMSPASFYGPQRRLCDVCILTFSNVIFSELQARFALRKAGDIHAANGSKPIFLFEHGGRTIVAYLCGIGATIAGNNVIELNWLTGATKFIMFGSAGSLNRQATEGRYVVPTEAYRDEGMSYHYAPPADYITIPAADRTEAFLRELGLPTVKGRVWTTDAFYRETKNQYAARRADGCLAVEMELAGVQAVCGFHGFELYDFLVTGDVLDAPVYETEGLFGANHNHDKLDIALHMAARI